MRLLAIAAFVALAACAGEQGPPVWYRSDGKPVGAAEMRSALLGCDAQRAVPVAPSPMPPVAQEGWAHDYDQLRDSPAFNRMSAPEIDSCLRSYGYRADQTIGSGSSTPPPSQ